MSLIAHSPPEGRQAVPWRADAEGPLRWAEKPRQISSSFTKGAPVGVKVPLRVETGLSHDTGVPGPWGSRATARAALALLQSSSSRSAERWVTALVAIAPVDFGSSSSRPERPKE